MEVKVLGCWVFFFPCGLVACWPKKLKVEKIIPLPPPLFTKYCLLSNIAKTSSLGTNPSNYVNSLPIKKFKPTEFGSKRSNTIFYSCHTKFYFCSALNLLSFLFSFVLNQCINPDYTKKERENKSEKILL